MNLYRFIFLSLCFILCTPTKAAHIIGGNLSYECIGGNEYEFTITLYRDCNPDLTSAAPFDDIYYLGLFTPDGTFQEWIEFGDIDITLVDPDNGNPCLELPPTVCAQKGEYKVTYSFPNIHNGYLINYQRCCRGAVINNVLSPEDIGTTMFITIPPSTVACNSSPVFENTPPVALCLQNEESIDLSGVDPDGDELVYTLTTPLQGLNSANPQVNPGFPGTPPPFIDVVWLAPYSETQPFPTAAPITLDPATGILSATPTQEGHYVVGIGVEEYRDGVLISETIRDFRFTVADCGLPFANSPIADVYCDGLTVSFSNTSSHAASYEWDFGDLTTDSDVSTLDNPTYTYPDAGDYTIQLIASDGPDCVDTSYFDMTIYLEIDPQMILPESQCFEGNSFDFDIGGTYAPNADIRWDFGPFGNPPFSNEIAPTGVSFSQGGVQNIGLYVSIGNCTVELTGEVLVGVNIPEIVESENQYGCVPFMVSITPDEIKDDLIYNWELGDGTTSAESSINHQYTSSGVYDITLSITDPATGCTSSTVLEEYVNVFNQPEAGFTIAEETIRLFDEFTIEDQSLYSSIYTYDFGDGAVREINNPTHSFQTEGLHTITQYVSNEGGCMDTISISVNVEPDYHFFVPTAFSPNKDGLNDLFRPYTTDIDNYQLVIYDRWGMRIYDQIGDNPTWYGYAPDGSELPQGVYYYEILFVNGRDFPIRKKGIVTLIR